MSTPSYRIDCRYEPRDGRWNHITEWVPSLEAVLTAFQTHQQEHWTSVSMTPAFDQSRLMAGGARLYPSVQPAYTPSALPVAQQSPDTRRSWQRWRVS